jgi:hypothetical protein
MNLLLTAILVINIIGLVIFAMFCKKLLGIYRDFQAFVTPEKPGDASALGNLVSNIADMFGRSITAQIKMTLMGSRSAEVKAEQAEGLDTAIAVAGAQNPMLGTIAQIPGVKRLLKKNPGLIDAVLAQFMNQRGASSAPAPQANNKPINFKL